MQAVCNYKREVDKEGRRDRKSRGTIQQAPKPIRGRDGDGGGFQASLGVGEGWGQRRLVVVEGKRFGSKKEQRKVWTRRDRVGSRQDMFATTLFRDYFLPAF